MEERKNFSVSCSNCSRCLHFDDCGETEVKNKLKFDGWLYHKHQPLRTEHSRPEENDQEVFVCPDCKVVMQRNGLFGLYAMLGTCVLIFLAALVARQMD